MNTFFDKIKIFSPLFFFPLTYIAGIAITEIFIFFFLIFSDFMYVFIDFDWIYIDLHRFTSMVIDSY